MWQRYWEQKGEGLQLVIKLQHLLRKDAIYRSQNLSIPKHHQYSEIPGCKIPKAHYFSTTVYLIY